jgi:adenylate cyclase
MPPSLALSPAERAVRAVLVVDMAESVRLMQEDEEDTVARWRSLVGETTQAILPQHEGRLVKSLGDGMLLEFPAVLAAVQAAFAIQRSARAANEDVPAGRRVLLRMGVQVGERIADQHDIYGHGVNLAARLAGLAGPGEIVVSAEVRDHLTPSLDADVEDLGECYLKHVRQPVRAYRIGPPGPRPVFELSAEPETLRPTVAVIPFAARSAAPEHAVLGEIVADDVIAGLSRSADLNVISRLSTSPFRSRDAGPAEIRAHLSADYVLSGAYRASGDRLVWTVELAESRSGRAVWADEARSRVGSVIGGSSELVARIVSRVGAAILARELERAQSNPLPTLESYTLLVGAINLMHRLSPRDFDRAREMLEALIERVPRAATPQAWLGKWHVLRVWQGWSGDAAEEARHALTCTQRALQLDPACTLALVVDGLVHMALLKRLEVAEARYERALEINPNESLGWLWKGTLHAFRGEGGLAMAGARRALRLSPLDPLRHYYDSLASTAALSAHRYEEAVTLAQRSLRVNRTHASTLRALAIAQWQLGRGGDAQRTVQELLRLEPGLTTRAYLERSPGSDYETGRRWAAALRSAGVPE